MPLHALFDGLAWFAAAVAALLMQRWRGGLIPGSPFTGDRMHLLVLLGGAGFGAYLFGSLNLWISGQAGLARSVEGALAGAIVAVELYKRHKGITGRSAALYALPVAIGIAVGRIGCFLAGMDDFTYGTPTSLPWGHDFGDGIPRHPVQLYESGLMALFALVYVAALKRRNAYIARNGFALVVLYYGIERFWLEFMKPYQPIIFGLTLFQLLSISLSVYAIAILRDRKPVHA